MIPMQITSMSWRLSKIGERDDFMGERTRGTHVLLDQDGIKEFFDGRSKKVLPHLYNYTNYQDNHPDLVLRRDRYEKQKVLPDLRIGKDTRVLDIGCGVGRWAGTVLSCGGMYVGVDYSEPLLALARNACEEAKESNRQYEFICSSFQDICEKLPGHDAEDGFDLIIVNGVMVYINDSDLPKCMANADRLLRPAGRLYIKEPIAYGERLTLNHVYSEELSSDYSAIYRSVDEYEALWESLGERYSMARKGDMWEDSLKNRKETGPYYWIMEKR